MYRNLGKLKNRIDSLHIEIEKAKEDFRELHKDRSTLAKERELKEAETDTWKSKCRELQLLKFGREIDLDELEFSSDRTREHDMEAQLSADREKFEVESKRLLRDVQQSKEQYIKVRDSSASKTQWLNYMSLQRRVYVDYQREHEPASRAGAANGVEGEDRRRTERSWPERHSRLDRRRLPRDRRAQTDQGVHQISGDRAGSSPGRAEYAQEEGGPHLFLQQRPIADAPQQLCSSRRLGASRNHQ